MGAHLSVGAPGAVVRIEYEQLVGPGPRPGRGPTSAPGPGRVVRAR